jgi:hypothetical protein
MNETRTSSILQRVPVILAVTAASYGLQLPPQVMRLGSSASVSSVTRQPAQQRLDMQQAAQADTPQRRNS